MRRYSRRSNPYFLGPARRDDCTSFGRQVHSSVQDDQFAAPERGRRFKMRNKQIDIQLTLLYLRISRTKLENASSTLIRCLADVSIKRQPKCFARSRPSEGNPLSPPLKGRQGMRTVHSNLTFVLEVALVGHNYDGKRILVLDPQNLLMERANFFKRVSRGDRVDEQKPFTSPHILLAHGTVTRRTRREVRLDGTCD